MVADCNHLYFTHAHMLLEMNAALGVKYLPVEARRMQPSSGSDSPLTTESVKHKHLQNLPFYCCVYCRVSLSC